MTPFSCRAENLLQADFLAVYHRLAALHSVQGLEITTCAIIWKGFFQGFMNLDDWQKLVVSFGPGLLASTLVLPCLCHPPFRHFYSLTHEKVFYQAYFPLKRVSLSLTFALLSLGAELADPACSLRQILTTLLRQQHMDRLYPVAHSLARDVHFPVRREEGERRSAAVWQDKMRRKWS